MVSCLLILLPSEGLDEFSYNALFKLLIHFLFVKNILNIHRQDGKQTPIHQNTHNCIDTP